MCLRNNDAPYIDKASLLSLSVFTHLSLVVSRHTSFTSQIGHHQLDPPCNTPYARGPLLLTPFRLLRLTETEEKSVRTHTVTALSLGPLTARKRPPISIPVASPQDERQKRGFTFFSHQTNQRLSYPIQNFLFQTPPGPPLSLQTPTPKIFIVIHFGVPVLSLFGSFSPCPYARVIRLLILLFDRRYCT
ncbi:hypothetical protein M440DRAFT_299491 [Trichoderma longibrachiatum ATCC 18648]|uniref:Uncharacterized protein n=1 Tax=Trichoderma longibrachiatum ATCC 18648 TaxID=983965 RepID=A0A2T4C500_TRILO|nr:hypothetical protein M440DRAFT_299491 [Trichoderma longibrachiatum ATCC 18648]